MIDRHMNVAGHESPLFSIVGLGSAGRKHYAAIRRLFPAAKIIGVSRSRPTFEEITYVDDAAAAVAHRPSIAIVASPAPHHIQHARPFVAAGIPTLIEKPMHSDAREVERFLQESGNRCQDVSVGYVLRQSRCIQAVRKAINEGAIGRVLFARFAVGMNLADWRPGTAPESGVSAARATGGGALMELSHEIDLMLWLLGRCKTLRADLARLGEIALDVEDFAEINATMESGARASIHLDMLSRPAFRTCQIVGSVGSIRYDLTARPARAEISDGVTWREIAEDSASLGELFERQLAAFSSGDPQHTMAKASDGLAVLHIVDAARLSAEADRSIPVAMANVQCL